MKQFILTLSFLFPPFVSLAQTPSPVTGPSTPVIADYLDRFDGEFAPVKIKQQKQMLHHSGLVLIDKLENIGYYRTFVAIKHNAYGAVNNAGKVIAPFKYDDIHLLDEKDERCPARNYCFLVLRLNGKYGAVDTLGNVLCEPIYNEVDELTPHVFKVKQNGLYGWLDIKTGQVLQSPKYTAVDQSYVLENAVQVKQGAKVGLAAEDGRIIVPLQYTGFSYLGYEGSTFFGYEVQGKTGIMDKSGKAITPPVYEKCSRGPSAVLFAVANAGKTGFVDSSGALVQPLKYTQVEPLVNMMKVAIGNKWGIINTIGKEIIAPQYEEIRAINATGEEVYGYDVPSIGGNGRKEKGPAYFIVTTGGNSGLLDRDGKPLIPAEYQKMDIQKYQEIPYVAALKNKRIVLLDFQGKVVMPAKYDDLLPGYSSSFIYQDEAIGAAKANYLPVTKNNHIGLFNLSTGQEILPPIYDWIQWQNPELIYLKSNDTSFLATKEGKVIRGGQQYGNYTAVDNDRLVEVRYTNDGSTIYTLTDIAGNKLYTNPNWEFSNDRYSRTLMPDSMKRGNIRYSDGLLKIWGDPGDNIFVDHNGKEVVFDGYDFVGDFYNGLALAGKKGPSGDIAYGIINRQQQVILPLAAEDISTLLDSVLLLKKEGLQGLVTKSGQVLLAAQYERVDKVYQLPCFKIYNGNMCGMTDSSGRILFPPEYDEIYYLEKAGLFRVMKGGKNGIADRTGRLVIPAIYDDMDINYGSDLVFPLLVKQGKWYFYLDKNGNALRYRSEKKKGFND
ncbi:MAG: WG repeat-containing protein [Chitinophaga sp.]|uniref:WG repeat-containing protein n=1 Tax=Chitinophaga sp. TaxID=1869181 RepID=UPI001B1261AF|nr:WG repeat-containing protein [Chitinophaga sp.]MBO9731320.1 WG repeat-containing protein [Chitinophaga sp.]